MRKNIRTAVIALLTIMVMCVTLTSCGAGSDTAADSDNTQVTQEAAVDETKAEETAESSEKATEATTEKATEKTTEKTSKTAKQTKPQKQSTTAKSTTQASVCYVEVSGKSYTVSVTSGDTAYSVLKKTGVSVSATNSEYGIYVEGINGKFEFDEGPESGWLYSVNGSTPNVSASKYSVKKGDKVKWYYTTGN